MRIIKIVDFYSIKTFHEVFNLSLVCICTRIADRVTYKLPKAYGKNIAAKFPTLGDCDCSKVSLRSVSTFENDSKPGALLRHLWGFWICLWEYLTLRKGCLLIFNYTNYFSLPIILILNRFLRKGVIFTMHGELGMLEKNVPLYKVSGIFKSIMLFSFKHWLHGSNAYILVLGNSIKNNLVELFPKIKNNVISICHPMVEFSQADWTAKKRDDKLVIGTVGIMNRAKGCDSLIRLSELLEEEIIAGKLEIRCVGRVSAITPSDYPLINWVGSADYLSREEFNNNIKELDYILYLYSDSYKFCASGAILDALICHRPIISLRNNYFDYILDGAKIGYLLPSVDSVYSTIRELIYTNESVSSFEKEFVSLKERTSVPVISDSLNEQLIERGI